MPIGTTAAIIGAGVLGAAGSALGAKSNSKAINKSTDAQLQANRESIAAQERALNQQLGVQRDLYNNQGALNTQVYNQNIGILNPYAQTGYEANDALNAIYGLPKQGGYTPTPLEFTPLPTAPALSATPTTPTAPAGQAPPIPQTYAARLRAIQGI